MTLTERDERLIQTLLWKVRLLSFEQITRTWWPDTESARTNAKRRVRKLIDNKIIVREHAFARPLLQLEAPVFRWKPGKAGPDYEKLSYELQSRWVEEPRRLSVYFASQRAANILGGNALGKIKNQNQVTHDLHLSELYLKLIKEEPKLAEAWAGEDVIAPTRVHQKLPDAILLDSTKHPRLVMEFGGAYPPDRVQAFHEDCAARGLPYEMW
jgi:hypothetical protein